MAESLDPAALDPSLGSPAAMPFAPGLDFHHFGLAVREPGPTKRFLSALGYACGELVFDPLQNVNLGMCTHPSLPGVEIICPANRTPGPLDALVGKHRFGAVYHLCFTSADLAGSLGSLRAAGLDPVEVVAPLPAVLFGGEHVSFYMIPGMGLIEIIEGTGRTVR